MGEKLDKVLYESNVSFKKVDKVMSGAFLYYASTLGFIFGWFGLALVVYTVNGEIPNVFILLLRVFYFLLSFIVGLKITIFLINLFRKK